MAFDPNDPYTQAVMQQGQAAGYNPMQIAALLGRTQVESGGDTSNSSGDGGTSFGAQQWRGDRFQKLQDLAASQGKSWQDPQVQAQHMFNELGGTESASGQALLAAQTPEDAQNAVSGYERPAGYTADDPSQSSGYSQALTNAQQIQAALTGGLTEGRSADDDTTGSITKTPAAAADKDTGDIQQALGGNVKPLGKGLEGVGAALMARDQVGGSQVLAAMSKAKDDDNTKSYRFLGANADGQTYTVFNPADGTVKTIPIAAGGLAGKGAAPVGPSVYNGPDGKPLGGADLLKALPTDDQAKVQAIVEGRMSLPTTGYAAKSPQVQRLIALVSQVDPTYEQGNAQARAKMLNNYGGGKIGDNINSLNTAIGHLGDLSTASDQLQNGNSPAMNWLKNAWATQTGKSGPGNYDAAANLVAEEMTRVYRGSGGAEADIKRLLADVNGSRSPAQINGTLAQIAKMVQSKVQSNQQQFDNTMGPIAGGGRKFLSDQSQGILSTLRQKGAADQTGSLEQSAPSGGPPTVSNKDDYDKLPKGSQYIAPDGSTRTKN